ncbi:MAG TPA: HEPN domain-containing protein [Candidatus Thermoplasmatota archaeon]|nr:HEPN domain-containing protein [Candidatus Thermoplasmatota archaeon]
MADGPEHDLLVSGSEEWLAAARDELAAGRNRVAFESARHAAELACKALLLRATGSYPKTHDVSGQLAQTGALPSGITGRRLSRFLADFTAGTYGFSRELTGAHVEDAIQMAALCVAACR